MQFVIPNIKLNPADALRKCGYHFERVHSNTDEVSAARSFGQAGYPRFHAYLRMKEGTETGPYGKNKDLCVNLHLDQKKPSYRGTSAHSGEYDGPLVEEETRRIQAILRDIS